MNPSSSSSEVNKRFLEIPDLARLTLKDHNKACSGSSGASKTKMLQIASPVPGQWAAV